MANTLLLFFSLPLALPLCRQRLSLYICSAHNLPLPPAKCWGEKGKKKKIAALRLNLFLTALPRHLEAWAGLAMGRPWLISSSCQGGSGAKRTLLPGASSSQHSISVLPPAPAFRLDTFCALDLNFSPSCSSSQLLARRKDLWDLIKDTVAKLLQ